VIVSRELSLLIELQELDLEIYRINDRLARIPAEREKIESEFRTQAAEFLQLQTRKEQMTAERKRLERDLADAQQHHEKYKQDLMRVRNEKEYTTALREIDATKKQISAFETDILKRIEELEKTDKEMETHAPEVERKRQEVDQLLAALDKEMEESQARTEFLKQRRTEMVAEFPRAQLALYERMSRSKRGQALAEIRNGICTACRVKVRPKVYSDVRKGEVLIECENCGRILYYRST
jgi:predicted  nucleic acid-binding Zn-ribbon protein